MRYYIRKYCPKRMGTMSYDMVVSGTQLTTEHPFFYECSFCDCHTTTISDINPEKTKKVSKKKSKNQQRLDELKKLPHNRKKMRY